MRLYELLHAYDFDEIMPVIADMFPGTGKYQEQLREGYDILASMEPVLSNKEIKYKLMPSTKANEQYMGAEDSNFDTTWQVCLGKNVSRAHGVDLSDIELVANCLVNVCLLGHHPRSFDNSYRLLTTK